MDIDDNGDGGDPPQCLRCSCPTCEERRGAGSGGESCHDHSFLVGNPWLDTVPSSMGGGGDPWFGLLIDVPSYHEGMPEFSQEHFATFLPLTTCEYDQLLKSNDAGASQQARHALVDVKRQEHRVITVYGAFANFSPFSPVLLLPRLPIDVTRGVAFEAVAPPPSSRDPSVHRYIRKPINPELLAYTSGDTHAVHVQLLDQYLNQLALDRMLGDVNYLCNYAAQTGIADELVDAHFRDISQQRAGKAFVSYRRGLSTGERQQPIKLNAKCDILRKSFKPLTDFLQPYCTQLQLDTCWGRMEPNILAWLRKSRLEHQLPSAYLFRPQAWDVNDTLAFAGRVFGYTFMMRLYTIDRALARKLLFEVMSNRPALVAFFLRAFHPIWYSALSDELELNPVTDFVRVLPANCHVDANELASSVRLQRITIKAHKLYVAMLANLARGRAHATLAQLLNDVDWNGQPVITAQSGEYLFRPLCDLLSSEHDRCDWSDALDLLTEPSQLSFNDTTVLRWCDKEHNVLTLGFVNVQCRRGADLLKLFTQGVDRRYITHLTSAEEDNSNGDDATGKRQCNGVSLPEAIVSHMGEPLVPPAAAVLPPSVLRLLHAPSDAGQDRRLVLFSYTHEVPLNAKSALLNALCSEVVPAASSVQAQVQRHRLQTLVMSASPTVLRDGSDVGYNYVEVGSQVAREQAERSVERLVVFEAHHLSSACLLRLLDRFPQCRLLVLVYDVFFGGPTLPSDLLVSDELRCSPDALVFGRAIEDLLAVVKRHGSHYHLPPDPAQYSVAREVFHTLLHDAVPTQDAPHSFGSAHLTIAEGDEHNENNEAFGQYAVSLLSDRDAAAQREESLLFVVVGRNPAVPTGAVTAVPAVRFFATSILSSVANALAAATEPAGSWSIDQSAPWSDQLLRQLDNSTMFRRGDVVRWAPADRLARDTFYRRTNAGHTNLHGASTADIMMVAGERAASTLNEPVLHCSLYRIVTIEFTTANDKFLAAVHTSTQMDVRSRDALLTSLGMHASSFSTTVWVRVTLSALDGKPDLRRRCECVLTARYASFKQPFYHSILVRGWSQLQGLAELNHLVVFYDTRSTGFGAQETFEAARLVRSSLTVLTNDWRMARSHFAQAANGRPLPQPGYVNYYSPLACALRSHHNESLLTLATRAAEIQRDLRRSAAGAAASSLKRTWAGTGGALADL